MVLPPLVIGLSLLILFQTPPGRAIENFTRLRMGVAVTYFLLPAGFGLGMLMLLKSSEPPSPSQSSTNFSYATALLLSGVVLLLLLTTHAGAPFVRTGTSLGKTIEISYRKTWRPRLRMRCRA